MDFVASSPSSLNLLAFYIQVPYKLIPYHKNVYPAFFKNWTTFVIQTVKN